MGRISISVANDEPLCCDDGQSDDVADFTTCADADARFGNPPDSADCSSPQASPGAILVILHCHCYTVIASHSSVIYKVILLSLHAIGSHSLDIYIVAHGYRRPAPSG